MAGPVMLKKAKMRIVTYNLHYGGHTRPGNHWQRIINELAPDLVLAQESFHPADYFSVDEYRRFERSVVWQSLPTRWGSAILALQLDVKKVSVPTEFEGWVAGGRIAKMSVGGVSRPAMVFSIHAPSPGPYERKVHYILDFIQDKIDCSDIIIGGDFNITTAVRHHAEGLNNTEAELAILDRLRKDFGLINSWQAIHPNRSLPQTLRWTGNKNAPYHCDGIFVPLSWVRYLESCEVADDGWSEMSDHNPIVTTFNAQQRVGEVKPHTQ